MGIAPHLPNPTGGTLDSVGTVGSITDPVTAEHPAGAWADAPVVECGVAATLLVAANANRVDLTIQVRGANPVTLRPDGNVTPTVGGPGILLQGDSGSGGGAYVWIGNAPKVAIYGIADGGVSDVASSSRSKP